MYNVKIKKNFVCINLFSFCYEKYIFTVGSYEGDTFSLAPGILVQVCGGGGRQRKPTLDGAMVFKSKI